jgi:hypothetical protein
MAAVGVLVVGGRHEAGRRGRGEAGRQGGGKHVRVELRLCFSHLIKIHEGGRGR